MGKNSHIGLSSWAMVNGNWESHSLSGHLTTDLKKPEDEWSRKLHIKYHGLAMTFHRIPEIQTPQLDQLVTSMNLPDWSLKKMISQMNGILQLAISCNSQARDNGARPGCNTRDLVEGIHHSEGPETATSADGAETASPNVSHLRFPPGSAHRLNQGEARLCRCIYLHLLPKLPNVGKYTIYIECL